jgi:hypothetical protein
MIVRTWHGWTTPDNADAYRQLLDTTIVPGILARAIPGLRGVDVLRRRGHDYGEVEFLTIMTFDGWPAVGPLPARTQRPRSCRPAPGDCWLATTGMPSTTS